MQLIIAVVTFIVHGLMKGYLSEELGSVVDVDFRAGKAVAPTGEPAPCLIAQINVGHVSDNTVRLALNEKNQKFVWLHLWTVIDPNNVNIHRLAAS